MDGLQKVNTKFTSEMIYMIKLLTGSEVVNRKFKSEILYMTKLLTTKENEIIRLQRESSKFKNDVAYNIGLKTGLQGKFNKLHAKN